MHLRVNFNSLVREIAGYDFSREKLIKQARVVLKTAKQLIYSIHRADMASSKKLQKKLQTEKTRLDSIASKHKRLAMEGSYSEATQEYVEAVCFFDYINNKKLPSKTILRVSASDYLMGICDFTGELTRRAVLLAAKQYFSEVVRIRDFVDMINGEFLKFDLRNVPLRKKYDQIKWNLKKLDEIMYDISKRKL